MNIITRSTRPMSNGERRQLYLAYAQPRVIENQSWRGSDSQYVWNWKTRKFELRDKS